jgi:RNA polymerase sigma-70 factor (ECF subfamily)
MMRHRKGRWLALSEDDRLPEIVSSEKEADFADRVLNREIADRLLGKLDPQHREILWLRFFRDESYDELTKSLRLPIGTVKSRLKRALDRVALLYRDLGGGGDEHRKA